VSLPDTIPVLAVIVLGTTALLQAVMAWRLLPRAPGPRPPPGLTVAEARQERAKEQARRIAESQVGVVQVEDHE
jgi:hypothetical protein